MQAGVHCAVSPLQAPGFKGMDLGMASIWHRIGWIGLGLMMALYSGPLRAGDAVPLSSRTVLPDWVTDEQSMQWFIARKYFQAPDACEPIQTHQWLCHVVYSPEVRIDTVIDFEHRREIALPRTQANYYLLSPWKIVASVALIASSRGWDLSLVWMTLDDLMVDHLAIFPTEYQPIISFTLVPKGKKVGFDIAYCLKEGCWRDSLRIKRGKLRIASHKRISVLINPN